MPTSSTGIHGYLERRTSTATSPGTWLSVGRFYNVFTNSVVHGPNRSDWRRRIANQLNATTTLTGVRYSHDLPPIGYACYKRTVKRTGNWTFYEYRGMMPFVNQAPSDPSLYLISSVRDKAVTAWVSRAREAQTALRSLVSLGELGDTTRMVNDRSRRIWTDVFRHLRGLKKRLRGKKNLRDREREVASSWLEYSFGWRPLVSDIEDGIKALRRYQSVKPPRIVVRASDESQELISASQTGNYDAFKFRYRVHTARYRVYGFKLYGVVGLADRGTVPALASEFGVRFDEIVPTIWELIPYSFLVDYFSNVGSVIDAFTFNTSVIRWLAQGEKKESRVISTLDFSILPATSSEIISEVILPPQRDFVRSRINVARRTADYGILVPPLGFKIPGLSLKWLNIAALARARNEARTY